MRKLARFLSYKLIRILDSIKPRTKKETRGEGWRGDGALQLGFRSFKAQQNKITLTRKSCA